jgi:hypothetical protein
MGGRQVPNVPRPISVNQASINSGNHGSIAYVGERCRPDGGGSQKYIGVTTPNAARHHAAVKLEASEYDRANARKMLPLFMRRRKTSGTSLCLDLRLLASCSMPTIAHYNKGGIT